VSEKSSWLSQFGQIKKTCWISSSHKTKPSFETKGILPSQR